MFRLLALSLFCRPPYIFLTSLHLLHFQQKLQQPFTLNAKKMQCPSNSFRYNVTQCECNPGYLFNFTSRSCYLFDGWGPVQSDSGVDYRSVSFPGSGTLFDFDSIRRLTQSQAVFLEATLIMLLSWLCFCFFARCAPLGDGRSIWFKIRWWISRLDICFASRHWLVWFSFSFFVNFVFSMEFLWSCWIIFISWRHSLGYCEYSLFPNLFKLKVNYTICTSWT